MNTLELKYLTQVGDIKYFQIGKVWEVCKSISMKFETGNVYCLDSHLSGGGWAISWLLAGQTINMKPKQEEEYIGNILWDGKDITFKALKEMGYPVGLTGFEGTFSEKKPVGKLFDKIIKKSSKVNSIDELREKFLLTKERLDRSIYSYSNEIWRATIAMGYARGKRIFGFPWMKPEYLLAYKDLWIKEALKPLIEEDCLVIIPTVFIEELSDMFTKVAIFNKPHGVISKEIKELKEFPDSYK